MIRHPIEALLRPPVELWSMAVAFATAAIAVHSVVDFNLHITSNAMMLSVILGFSYGMAVKRAGRDSSGDC